MVGTTYNVEAAKEVEMEGERAPTKKLEDNYLNGEKWILYVDGALNEKGLGASMMPISLGALRFRFPASTNEAEYEALIARLKLAKELKVII